MHARKLRDLSYDEWLATRYRPVMGADDNGGKDTATIEDVRRAVHDLAEAVTPERIAQIARDAVSGRAPGQRSGYRPDDTIPPPAQAGRDRLAPSERVADWVAERHRGAGTFTPEHAREFSFGRAIRGMATGRWDGAEIEQRAMSEGTDSAGGFLVPEVLGGPTIDYVRNAARIFEAGAVTVPVESDSHSIPRVTAGVTGAWRNEGATVSQETPTVDRVTFKVRSLAVEVKLSMELLEDMPVDSFDAITRDIVSALAVKLDYAGLRGSGTPPEPKGVRNQSGITVQALGAGNGATPTDWSPQINAVGAVQALNFEPNASIHSARTAKTFASLKDTTNQPLAPPSYLDGLSNLVSNQIPGNLTVGSSNDCSELFIGQWDQLLIGIRPQLGARVRQLNEKYSDTMEVAVQAWLRADVQLSHAEAFAVVTGVRP